MLRIVIFDDEERIGLQLKELLEQSGDDLVVDFFQDWHALQFYFSQHAHIDAVFMDICFQGSTSSGIDFAEKICTIPFANEVYLCDRTPQGIFAADFYEQNSKPVRLSAKALLTGRRCRIICKKFGQHRRTVRICSLSNRKGAGGLPLSAGSAVFFQRQTLRHSTHPSRFL